MESFFPFKYQWSIVADINTYSVFSTIDTEASNRTLNGFNSINTQYFKVLLKVKWSD